MVSHAHDWLWIKSRVKNLRLNCAKEDAASVAAIVAALDPR